MKRNKGKVHPSSSSDSLSVLTLLPAAILTLVSVLSLDERHVLAYMITRSLKSTAHPDTTKKPNKKSAPLINCDCFHCYTTFWFRWDSSPNRELIHQAIEAFEDHLSNADHHLFNKNKKKDKSGRRREVNEKISISAAEENKAGPLETRDGVAMAAEMELDAPSPPVVNNHNHKGLARKMLPDVMGIFNSRLWSLWSPNV
ncbi:hypothetical protein PHJA_000983900 [Phtheirospermum japonicum]|uniref:Uncharacterized protein n=1 Tax=Phtheirospermum japonicum TaxID=374723 RepID=A0A830BQS8_9LAMI|nr:hypothetical protein PHJA_000983900 [Phtheirospermum japonicum]